MAISDPTDVLQYLSVLIKHGNYTKAAKDLYISQPYLTQTIKKIEQDLGIEIINRQSNPIQLTDAGKMYYNYLNDLEKQQLAFRQKISKYAYPEEITIRIGVLSSLGTYLLPLFLVKFLAKYPDVQIQLIEDLPEKNEARLLANELDFLLGQNTETFSSKLTFSTCGTHHYYAIIPKNSHFYQNHSSNLKKQQLSLKDLLSEPLILTKKGSAIRRQVDYLIKRHRIEPNVVIESNNIFTVTELAKAGAGVTLIPESIQNIPKSDNYVIYPIANDLLSLDYFIAYKTNRSLSSIDTTLIDIFHQSISENLKSCNV